MRKQFTELVKACCALITLTLLTFGTVQAQYCLTNASAISTADEFISNVTYGAFSNTSGPNVANDVTDFTGLGSIGTINPDIATTLSVEIGNPFGGDVIYVYIDYDGDGDFDANDLVGQANYAFPTNPTVVPITVPSGAVPGLTRMRVRMTFGASPGPCTAFTWGEVEDYLITIAGGSCNPPAFVFTTATDCPAPTYDVFAQLNGFGDTGGTPNFSATIALTRSDGVEVDAVTLLSVLEGQNVPIIEDIPLGVTVTAVIQGFTLFGDFDNLCVLNRTFLVSGPCPPLNTTPCTAIALSCESDITATTIGSVLPAAVCDFAPSTPMVFYTFTNTAANSVLFSYQTCNPGTNFDTDSHLFTGSCGSLTCLPTRGQGTGFFGSIGYLDGQLDVSNGFGGPTCTSGQVWASGGSVVLAPGQQIYLGIDGFFNSGTFQLTTSCEDITCTNPTLAVTPVDDQGNPITDCVDPGTQVFALVELTGGTFNASYSVTATANFVTTTQVVSAGGSFTFGPYTPGSTINVIATGVDQQVCTASGSTSTTVCPPVNDVCTDAIPLVCEGTVFGSNIGAAPDQVCDGFSGTTSGVWYSISVTETSLIELETCAAGTNFDSDFSVFTGECGNLTCFNGFGNNGWLDGNFACPFAGFAAGSTAFLAADFVANPGTTYYLLVHGFGGVFNQGTFELNMTCTPVLCNSPALTATAVDGGGNPIVGCAEFTPGAQFFVLAELAGGDGNVTYNVAATANFATTTQVVAADGSATFGPYAYGTTVNVAAAGVQDPICEAFASASAVFCPPTNDVCSDAVALECNSTVGGTTLGATSDNVCSFFGTGLGVWYTLTVPSAATITLETCSPTTNFDSDLTVFTGSCGDLTCFPGWGGGGWIDGGGCDFVFWSSGGSFEAEADVTYYILLHGFGPTSVGNYEMSVSCVDAACSPTATATAVADGEGNPLVGCVSEGGEYFVSVALSGGTDNTFYNVSINGGAPVLIAANGSGILGPIAAGAVAEVTAVGQQNNLCVGTATADGSCPCDQQPSIDPDFLLGNSIPFCSDPDLQGYNVVFASPENLGSSAALIFIWSYGGQPNDTLVIPAGESVSPLDLIPLNQFVSVEIRLSYEPCNTGFPNIFPLFGFFGQPADGCDPDCEGVPGGPAEPGTACVTAEGDPGIYDASCGCQATPVNDLCSGAIAIGCGETILGSTVAAGADNAICAPYASAPGVWYTFTSAVSGTISLETCNAGTNYDSDFSLYTGSCDNLSCSDDFGFGSGFVDGNGSCSFAGFAAGGPGATFTADAGVTYYLLVSGWFGQTGNFTLTVECDLDEVTSSIAGTVNWNSNCGTRPAVVNLYTPNTNTLVNTYPVTVQSNGTFEVLGLTAGTYDVIVKVQGYLAKGTQDVAVGAGVTPLALGAIINGDVNNNNLINLPDVSLVNASFGSTTSSGNYNPIADLNCSGSVNLTDVSLLNAGFAQSGAVAPL